MSSRRVLHVAGSIRRAMIAHAARASPLECCGFLVGREHEVFCSVEMDNVAESPVRFQIDDAAHIELRRVLRRAVPPLAILGVYHSHPNGDARPSETDVAQAFYPDWVHVIVGLGAQKPIVRGFQIVGHEVHAVALR